MTTRVERRHVVSCTPGADAETEAWATGTTTAWLDAVIDRDASQIRSGGDERMAGAMLKGLHKKLFG